MNVGPTAREQLRRLRSVWHQGEDVLVSGAKGSGKTTLIRHLADIRVDNGGHVIVFVLKPRPDATITKDYADYTRWTRYRKRAPSYENKVLLLPAVEKLKGDDILALQKEVFKEAIDEISAAGHRTVVVDDALYLTNPQFLDLSDELAMMHAIGRSGGLTLIDGTQRPSHLPLIAYGSASHAFISRTRELADLRRLAELGARESSKELSSIIHANGKHDFTWIPIDPDWPAEKFNLGA